MREEESEEEESEEEDTSIEDVPEVKEYTLDEVAKTVADAMGTEVKELPELKSYKNEDSVAAGIVDVREVYAFDEANGYGYVKVFEFDTDSKVYAGLEVGGSFTSFLDTYYDKDVLMSHTELREFVTAVKGKFVLEVHIVDFNSNKEINEAPFDDEMYQAAYDAFMALDIQ